MNAPQYVRPESKAIASAAGARKADLADPKKAERSAGYVVGPFGQRKHLRTFIDASALALDEIVVNGGRRGLQIVLEPEDLIAATSAVVVPLRS